MRSGTLASIFVLAALAACSSADVATTTADGGSASTADGSTADGGTTTDDGAATTIDCTGATTTYEHVVCAATAYIATLTTAQQSASVYAFTNEDAKTVWSNLPGVARNGTALGDLSTGSRAAFLAMAKIVLSTQGYEHMIGVFAGDDYLKSLSTGGGPGGGSYSSDNYHVAFIGTPSTSNDWMLQIGGHHMAFNITYRSGVGYPVPHHLGAEPKASFTVSGNFAGTYQPLQDKGAAMLAIFNTTQLSAAQLTTAYLSGQTFADVLLGPVEYGKGTETGTVVYPTQTGVLVSDLTSAQQALVTAAIKTWVDDYSADVATPLLAAYTSADAYSKTYLAYGSPTEGSIDADVNTTYMRIDGPRLWLEMSCQAGVVIQGTTHFHTIYRDKTEDYGASL